MRARLSVVLSSFLLMTSCGQSGSPSGSGSGQGTSTGASAAVVPDKVLARVNGVPITETDLELKLSADSHEAAGNLSAADRKKNVLDYLILHELMAQKAASMGLDQDAKYQAELRKLEAQLAAFRRQELSERLLAKEGDKRNSPSEEEMRAYFQRNEKRIRTTVHVLQILKRSESAIVEARSMIERGKSFEEVAASYFPNLPEGQKPWDLGFLTFSKIPEAWRDTLTDLKPGEMSGILRGPNERYWLIKLVESKEDPNVTFESAKEGILLDMKAARQQRLRDGYEKELRDAAKIEMVSPP
ncbi:MAG: peptidyl-prolyl cis-trans isomerase [Polyangiaceae bacterium]